MPRIASSLFLAALLGLTPPALAETAGARIEGSWMAIGDMLGVLPGHIEVLTIDGAQARSVTWRAPEGDCAAQPAAPGCRLPIPTASGAFLGNSFEIGVAADAANASPFAGEAVAPLWPLLALDGAPWSMFRQGGRLMTTREATIAGTNVPMLRLWLQVDPALPERYFDYLMAFDLDIARSVCAASTLHEDAEAWAAFSVALEAAAPVLHDRRLVRAGLPAEGAAPSEEATQAFALLDHLASGTADLPQGAALLPGLPWPVAQPVAAAASECLTRVFGG